MSASSKARQKTEPKGSPPNPSSPSTSSSLAVASTAGMSRSSIRALRNAAEKQRRDRINGLINELATIVPLVSECRRKLDKTSILRLSAAYLRLEQCSLSLYNLPSKTGVQSGSGYDAFSPCASPWSVSNGADGMYDRDGGGETSSRVGHPSLASCSSHKSPSTSAASTSSSSLAIHTSSGKSVDLYQIFDSLNGFVMILTTTGKIVLVTHSVERYLGHSDIDLIGHNLSSFVHPADHQHVVAVLGQAYRQVERTGDLMSERISVRCRLREKSQPRSEVITYQMVQVTGHLILSNSVPEKSANNANASQRPVINSDSEEVSPPLSPTGAESERGVKRSTSDEENRLDDDDDCKGEDLMSLNLDVDNNIVVKKKSEKGKGNKSAAGRGPNERREVGGGRQQQQQEEEAPSLSPTKKCKKSLATKESSAEKGKSVAKSGGSPSRKRTNSESQSDAMPLDRIGAHARTSPNKYQYLFKGFVTIIETNPMAELNLTDADLDEYVTRMTLDGTLLFTDHRISLILGHSPKEVLGRSAYDYIKQDDHSISLFAHRLMLSNANGTGIIVHRLRSKSGATVYLQSSGCLQYDRGTGQVDHFVCVSRVLHTEEGDRERQKFVQKFTPHIHDSTPAALYESLQIVIGPHKCTRRYLASSSPILGPNADTFSSATTLNAPSAPGTVLGTISLDPQQHPLLMTAPAHPSAPIASRGLMAIAQPQLQALPLQPPVQQLTISSVPFNAPTSNTSQVTTHLTNPASSQSQSVSPQPLPQSRPQLQPQSSLSQDSDIEIIDVKPALGPQGQVMSPAGKPPPLPLPTPGSQANAKETDSPPPPVGFQPGMVFHVERVAMDEAAASGAAAPSEIRIETQRVSYAPGGGMSRDEQAAVAARMRQEINTLLQEPYFVQHAAATGRQPYHIPTPSDPFVRQSIEPQIGPATTTATAIEQYKTQQVTYSSQQPPAPIQLQIQAVAGQEPGTTQLTLTAAPQQQTTIATTTDLLANSTIPTTTCYEIQITNQNHMSGGLNASTVSTAPIGYNSLMNFASGHGGSAMTCSQQVNAGQAATIQIVPGSNITIISSNPASITNLDNGGGGSGVHQVHRIQDQDQYFVSHMNSLNSGSNGYFTHNNQLHNSLAMNNNNGRKRIKPNEDLGDCCGSAGADTLPLLSAHDSLMIDSFQSDVCGGGGMGDENSGTIDDLFSGTDFAAMVNEFDPSGLLDSLPSPHAGSASSLSQRNLLGDETSNSTPELDPSLRLMTTTNS